MPKYVLRKILQQHLKETVQYLLCPLRQSILITLRAGDPILWVGEESSPSFIFGIRSLVSNQI